MSLYSPRKTVQCPIRSDNSIALGIDLRLSRYCFEIGLVIPACMEGLIRSENFGTTRRFVRRRTEGATEGAIDVDMLFAL
jgi:hypothetical protein